MLWADFVHLHIHTQYSLLDGACRIPDLLKLASQYKISSLAITDHGNIFGAIEFYLEAQNSGIKPIIGCEVYVAPNSRFEKKTQNIEEASFHFVLLVKDESGYRNLMKLVSIGYLEGFYYRPRIDKEILSQYAKGLIGLSSCLKGEISYLLKNGQLNSALKAADEFCCILGKDNFYLELMDNNLEEQKIVNEGLLKISKELNIPLVATNDVHYLKKEEAKAHEVLLCIQTQTTLDAKNRLRFQTEEFYFKSPDEMKEIFKEIPQSIKNTLEISDKCNLELDFSSIHLPKYNPPQGRSCEDYLKQLCYEGLNRRYKEPSPKILERLEHELKVINQMGFPSYFLIVYDFIDYAKKNNISVGPGRGSVAGSLVSYLLGITDIDPIKYNLIFERFLNPERLGLPDIDIDFCFERRQEVIDYVIKKYGQENVAQVITFGTMQARQVVRDVGRVMGMAYNQVDRIAKLISPDPNIRLEDALRESELKYLYQLDPQIKNLIDIALFLEGLVRHASIHAAGLVISDKPLTYYTPLFESQEGKISTGLSMNSLEKIGLLKIDLLGLKTLTVIDQSIKLIDENQGISLDIDKIPLDDEKTFKLLCEANTLGVFQLESSGMRELLKKIHPDCFEDLIAVLALHRPGPIGSGMVDEFTQRKHNKTTFNYLDKRLEPILSSTYGIIVYQEQIIEIVSKLAGFSLAQADLLRRAISKKIPEVMEEQRAEFIKGCFKNEIPQDKANKIFDLIEYFSGYGFNRCVVGDTQVIDADSGKLFTIRELFEKKKLINTFCCDDNLKIKKKRITDIMNNGIKDVYKVTTSLGKEIIATSNHPFLTVEGWKRLEDLSRSEKIALPRRIPYVGNKQLESYKLIVLAGILSEGNTCHPSGVYYYNNDILQVEDFVENLERFQDTQPKVTIRRGNYEVYAGTGKDTKFATNQTPWNKGLTKEEYSEVKGKIGFKKSGVRTWIEKLGLDYKKASEKFIPAEIFSLIPENIALFLGRLWTGDGFIFSEGNTIPFYTTSSRILAYQVQNLLLRFGIISRVAKKLFKYKHKEKISLKEGFAVYLQGNESIRIFLERICPYIINRDSEIEKLHLYYNIVSPESESKDVVPAGIKFLVKKEKDRMNLTWKDLEKKSSVCMREFLGKIKPYKKGFRRSTLRRLAEYLESPTLLRYATSEIYWDSIKSIEYAGKEETYDLEIEDTHNFIANGIIVHNSHSAAYALISYRTAYLKANFPLEFIVSLLNSEKDKTEKIAEYVNEANRLNIKVLPPDINESSQDFKIEGKNIRFGLLAIKNVGLTAIESIQKEREKEGKFLSLEDFCRRVDLRVVNRKVIESLIKAGVFDCFRIYRSQMMAEIDDLLEEASLLQRDRNKGQLSLFDKVKVFKEIIPPKIKEWPEPQLLAFEKEMLGFYISGHPLARYAPHIKRFNTTSSNQLHKMQDGIEVKIMGMITKIKQTHTKKNNEKMAIIKLEDLEGDVEVIIFPATYTKVYNLLQPNSIVLVKGKLNLREESPKITANTIVTFQDVYNLISGIDLDLTGIPESLFYTLKEKLSNFKGDIPVRLHSSLSSLARIFEKPLSVQPNETLIEELDSLLGEGRLSLTL